MYRLLLLVSVRSLAVHFDVGCIPELIQGIMEVLFLPVSHTFTCAPPSPSSRMIFRALLAQYVGIPPFHFVLSRVLSSRYVLTNCSLVC